MISFCGCCCPSVVEWYPVWSFSKMLSETQIHLTYLHKDLSLLFQPFTPGSSEIYARRSTPIALNGKLEHCFQSDTDFHIKPWMCPVIIGAGSNFPLVETSGKERQICKHANVRQISLHSFVLPFSIETWCHLDSSFLIFMVFSENNLWTRSIIHWFH